MTVADDTDPREAIRRLNRFGLAAVALLIGGAGVWAATTQLAGAVIASGTLVVQSNVKKVQHPSGGTVGALLVDEGTNVEFGQVLVRLDDTLARTTLNAVRSGLDTQLMRAARLAAERDGAAMLAVPEELGGRSSEPGVAAAIAGESKLFEARRATRRGQSAQLREQIDQLRKEIDGIAAQAIAKDDALTLVQKQVQSFTALFAQNLTTGDKLTALQRDAAELQGQRGELVATIARARGRISEIELQVLQLDKDFQASVLNDLRDAEARIAELREKATAAEDLLRRVEIRAPQAGTVHELAIHTVGGVIAPGETLMQIVPRADDLVIDARVAPEDIDQIAVGGSVSVRIQAGNRRTTAPLEATVTRISADLNRDGPTTPPYYLVRMAFAGGQAPTLEGARLLPGMPVEAYIATQDRTPLDYLLKPLGEQIGRTFRER
ncbi:MAG: HlyD family type I secretion periplasmic adaptor subunit [Bauldia sp.]